MGNYCIPLEHYLISVGDYHTSILDKNAFNLLEQKIPQHLDYIVYSAENTKQIFVISNIQMTF